jgi:hypothetical protein
MSHIVISYRRSDSQAIAGRIRDRLEAHFGAGSIYMDIDSIPLGTDFREHVDHALNQGILLAIVGPKWLGPREGGKNRIHDENDPVRVEIETALRRQIQIIPVLVDGANMPKTSELPESLKDFSFRNAAEIDAGRDFHPHMDRLVRSLDGIRKQQGTSRISVIRPKALVLLLGCAGVGAGALIVAWGLAARSPPPSKAPQGAVKAEKPIAVGGPLPGPPPSISVWEMTSMSDLDKSLVRLEASGPNRDLYVLRPNDTWRIAGALVDAWIFTGKRDGNEYSGTAWAYAGACGRFSYAVEGPVLNDDTTVVLKGKAPQIDQKTCKQVSQRDEELVFNFKYRQ